MKVLPAILVALSATLAVGLYYREPPPGDPNAMAIDACEGKLLQRLKAPSAYKAVSREVTLTKPFTSEWWHTTKERYGHLDMSDEREKELRNELIAIRERYEAKGYMVASVQLVYDAPNSFGTPIRGQAYCDVVFDPNAIPLEPEDVEILFH